MEIVCVEGFALSVFRCQRLFRSHEVNKSKPCNNISSRITLRDPMLVMLVIHVGENGKESLGILAL